MENKIYLVSADWCTNCKPVKNLIAEKELNVTYIDAEEQPEIPSQFGIMSLPSIVDNRLDNPNVYKGQIECLQFVNNL